MHGLVLELLPTLVSTIIISASLKSRVMKEPACSTEQMPKVKREDILAHESG